jgi:hypothetical protein
VPLEIRFSDPDPRYVFDRDCLEFHALVDGKPVQCLVTGELLLARFGARDMTEDSLRQAYREHTAEIQEIARNHIANGWIDEEGRTVLTTRFTRLNVTFSERLNEKADFLALAKTAHRMLTDIIGPYTGTVIVEWDADEVSPGQPSIRLRIVDPSIPYSAKASLHPKEWDNPIFLQLTLARVWTAVLEARSREHIIKAG